MAGSFSDFAELAILDGLFTQFGATLYVGLYTATPSDTGGGTEVTGGSYARKSTTNSDWAAAAAGARSTSAELAFTPATADWGTVTQFGIFDAVSGGNLVIWGDLTTSKVVSNGDTAKFAIGALTLNLD